ncbi:MAG TPA: hypothetical protein VHB27_19325 [Rhodopila sp.]|uniref:hypothetical protein n=1 Tax=Rhodopila sp. TaxID=2480087 RepID=UPI002CE8E9EC|nr:hypothetical protein [Rhodopila sp.]HVY17382.1 hypothetical protein [Rhodopila sp.]
MARWRSTLLILLAVGMPMAASAQMINPFRSSRGPKLNTDDLAALNQATMQLLQQPRLAAGASAPFGNAKTGMSGSVTAGNAVKRHGLACRVTNYTLTGPGTAPERKSALTWCKTGTGWKLG